MTNYIPGTKAECAALHRKAHTKGRKLRFLHDNHEQLSVNQICNFVEKHELLK